MTQQISDSELELMKIIWGNGGTALYAQIMEALSKKDEPGRKTPLSHCYRASLTRAS